MRIIDELIDNTNNYKDIENKHKYIVIRDCYKNNISACDRSEFMNYNDNGFSVHYCIDGNEAIKCVEPTRVAYHSSNSSTVINNSNAICIELAIDKNQQSEEVINNGIIITRMLMKLFDISCDNVIKAKDITGEDNPKYFLDNPTAWHKFKNEIKKKQEEIDDPENNRISSIKGIVLHCNITNDKGLCCSNYRIDNANFHFVIDDTEFKPLCEPEKRLNHCKDYLKQTYISSALFKSKPNKYTLGIDILYKNDTNIISVEKNLLTLLHEMVMGLKLTADDVWREYDLNMTCSPWIFSNNKDWEKFIECLKESLNKNYKEFQEYLKNYQSCLSDKTLAELKEKIKIDFNTVKSENPIDDRKIEKAKNPSVKDGVSENFTTDNKNNVFITSVQQNSSGCSCVRNNDSAEVKIESDVLYVEPIYPDLIVPPIFSSSDQNENNTPRDVETKKNTIKDVDDNISGSSILSQKEFNERQKTFNAKLMSAAKGNSSGKDFFGKIITGKPVNNNDPYPVDDKIIELESHSPKVKIDSIKYNLNDCNHTGCKIGNPLMKNLIMMCDALESQSKRSEARIVRLENIISTLLRNFHRLGSRMNINCVYYGGQDQLGKYKNIRCLHADRINDGGIMSIDQCLSCSRYEPVLGQVYDILDETGANASIVLDNAQMSYMSVKDYIKFTRTEEVLDENKMADVSKKFDETPTTFDKMWPKGFIMNFEPSQLETHCPNVNSYDVEKIKQYKNKRKSKTEYIEAFTDTRTEADSYEENKYSTDNINTNFGSNFGTNSSGSSSGSGGEIRRKIIDRAKEICALGAQGLARYSQAYRKQTVNGILYHDCSSFAQECYKTAGLSIGNTTYDQYPQCISSVGGICFYSESQAIPGDLVFFASYPGNASSEDDLNNPNKVGSFDIYHVGVYAGDGKFYEAATDENPVDKQVKEAAIAGRGMFCFGRPKCLVDADKTAASNGGIEENGTVDGMNYVYKFPEAVCTCYNDRGGTAGGAQANADGTICAVHGIPFGTKVYIPKLKGVINGTGIFDCMDTGGPFFDFDINTTKSIGKGLYDAYILNWGTGAKAQSFEKAVQQQKDLGQWNGPNCYFKDAYDKWAGKFKTENFDFSKL